MAGFRLFDLNDEQKNAVTTTHGPLLILAGAGTGKTRVITARIAYLIAQGVKPESILGVTFTNKAANEMRERLAGMVDSAQAKKVTLSTFHALCVRILRAGIEHLGYKRNFTIYDDSDQLGLIRKIITRMAARDEKLDPHLAKNLISKAKSNACNAPEGEDTLITAVFAKYQQDLKLLNAVDFDDLLLLAVKLLNSNSDVREQWQRHYQFLMVDEFQDTNRLQLEIISLLAKKSPSMPANICVVGDDDQSIYGWRGAEVSNILEFEAHFSNPAVVKLEQNYRSTNMILETANSLIRNNPRRRSKSLWSAHGEGEKVRIIQMPDDRQEAQFVVDDLQRVKEEQGLRWEDFAVLYRMNAQSRLLEENLRRNQIPYRLVGGKSFFDRREVKDLLAYANCLLNSADDVSLLRIINTPARGISAVTTERALERSIQEVRSLHETLEDPEFRSSVSKRTSRAIEGFLDLLGGYRTRVDTPGGHYADLLRALLEEIDYISDLKRSCKSGEEAMNRETSINDLLDDLERFQSREPGKGLQGFLDEVCLDQDRQKDEKDKGSGITLITLHAAKGLEFPHVYLIGLEEGLIPHDRSKAEGTIDEERRLLYVGVTRAMRQLTLTWCRTRRKFGSASPCHPSAFIKEFKKELLEVTDLESILNTPVNFESAGSRFAAMRAAIAR